MNRFDQQWQKLTALARQAPGGARDLAAPPGFATRVAARAATSPVGNAWAVFERFALRGLLVAAACGIVAVALNYSTFTSEPSDDYASTDTVSELLDFS
jgi:hypothetical protein